jgi:methyl-accepting chemotaxis protein
MAVEETRIHTIGIIGGGKSGHAMLRFLLKTHVAKVVFIMDPNSKAPAMQEAIANKIPTFTELSEALRKPYPDFVFSVSSNEEANEIMKQTLKDTTTRIINQATSRMIIELVEDNRAQLQRDVGEAVVRVKDELLTTLGTSEEQVFNITQVMASMQMLALNASIEAAKVGHAGKGFAVVADNMTKSVDSVRRLTDGIVEVNDTLKVVSSEIENVMELLK